MHREMAVASMTLRSLPEDVEVVRREYLLPPSGGASVAGRTRAVDLGALEDGVGVDLHRPERRRGVA